MLGIIATVIALALGGWATITVENLPDHFVAGKTTNLTFSVRQHGEDLLEGLQPTVTIRSGSNEKTFRAAKTNRAGFYTAGVNIPAVGQWDVTIHSSFGRSRIDLLPVAAVASGARTASVTHEERGRQLFVAKGCSMCHMHASVSGSGIYKVGPELTQLRLATDYLEKFLANPAIKAATPGAPRMPNLGLKSSEIASLAAFINAGARQELSAREAAIKQ